MLQKFCQSVSTFVLLIFARLMPYYHDIMFGISNQFVLSFKGLKSSLNMQSAATNIKNIYFTSTKITLRYYCVKHSCDKNMNFLFYF